MAKITNVKSLGDKRFHIIFSVNGKKENHIVKCDFFNIEGDELPMPYFVPETKGFFEVWGGDPSLRRALSEMINNADS